MTKGLGKYQLDRMAKPLTSIIEALSDEKEHRYKDIKKETGLNDPTLNDNLKRLTGAKLVKRRVDTESGDYPYPAYYKIEPDFLTALNALNVSKGLFESIEPTLLKTKDPMFIIELIHLTNSSIFAENITNIIKDNISDSQVYYLLSLFVWEQYKAFTWELIEASKKHKDIINIEKLVKYQQEKLEQFKEYVRKMKE